MQEQEQEKDEAWVIQSDRSINYFTFGPRGSQRQDDIIRQAANYGNPFNTVAVVTVKPTPAMLAELWRD